MPTTRELSTELVDVTETADLPVADLCDLHVGDVFEAADAKDVAVLPAIFRWVCVVCVRL